MFCNVIVIIFSEEQFATVTWTLLLQIYNVPFFSACLLIYRVDTTPPNGWRLPAWLPGVSFERGESPSRHLPAGLMRDFPGRTAPVCCMSLKNSLLGRFAACRLRICLPAACLALSA